MKSTGYMKSTLPIRLHCKTDKGTVIHPVIMRSYTISRDTRAIVSYNPLQDHIDTLGSEGLTEELYGPAVMDCEKDFVLRIK